MSCKNFLCRPLDLFTNLRQSTVPIINAFWHVLRFQRAEWGTKFDVIHDLYMILMALLSFWRDSFVQGSPTNVMEGYDLAQAFGLWCMIASCTRYWGITSNLLQSAHKQGSYRCSGTSALESSERNCGSLCPASHSQVWESSDLHRLHPSTHFQHEKELSSLDLCTADFAGIGLRLIEVYAGCATYFAERATW